MSRIGQWLGSVFHHRDRIGQSPGKSDASAKPGFTRSKVPHQEPAHQASSAGARAKTRQAPKQVLLAEHLPPLDIKADTKPLSPLQQLKINALVYNAAALTARLEAQTRPHRRAKEPALEQHRAPAEVQSPIRAASRMAPAAAPTPAPVAAPEARPRPAQVSGAVTSVPMEPPVKAHQAPMVTTLDDAIQMAQEYERSASLDRPPRLPARQDGDQSTWL